MKISDVAALGGNNALSQAVDERFYVGKTNQTEFKSQLGALTVANREETLKALIDKIDTSGAELFKKADVTALRKYRNLVSEYMNEAVHYSFDFKKENCLDARGRLRSFSNINLVNKKLDELTKEVLKGQEENLAVLGQIDEIRGLLVDMYL